MVENDLLQTYQSRISEGLGEDFFLRKMRSLKDSIEEIGGWIAQRGTVSRCVLENIEWEQHEKEQRLGTLSSTYAAERVVLIQGIDSLCKERRSELVQSVKDTIQLRKEARQKLEEYEGTVQLFRVASMKGSCADD